MDRTPLPCLVDRLFPRRRIVLATALLVAVSACLLGVNFAFERQGSTPFGITLGGDFPQFYIAGKILRSGDSGQLYDLGLQAKMYHALLPREPARATLPYAYPPLVAVATEPLAALPYPLAALLWTGCSIALYLCGLSLLARSFADELDVRIAMMLSLAFEPFLIECVHGGQISTIAFAAIGLAIYLQRRGNLAASGLAVGLLAYKPTLWLLVLAMLAASRQWRMVAGAIAAAIAGALASLAIVGAATCRRFAELMQTYVHVVNRGDGFPLWKYVDVSAFVKLLAHRPDAPGWLFALAGASVMAWWLWRQTSQGGGVAWDVVILATLLFNLYVGVYDTVLLAPAMWLMADRDLRQFGKLSLSLKWMLSALFVTPWISPICAEAAGVQVYTLAMAGALLYRIRPRCVTGADSVPIGELHAAVL